MALKRYKLPCGVLIVNEGKIEETFFELGEAITLQPKQTKFLGGTHSDLVHYLSFPGFWESQKVFASLKEREGKVRLLLDVSKVDRWGDHLMLTIVAKAYKEVYEEDVEIHIHAPEKFEPAWLNNPHIHAIHTAISDDEKFDSTVDLNGVEMAFKSDGKRCADAILGKAGVATVNKTPVYRVTEEEQEWARRELEDVARPLIGFGFESYAAVRTYPHMKALADLVESYGLGSPIQLDERAPSGEFRYTFREMAALTEQCELVFANDSGLLHLAGALKRRVVGVFGHTDGSVICQNYEKAIPINAGGCEHSPCWWEVPCIEGATYQEKETKVTPRCLTELAPATVLQKALARLGESRKVLCVMLTFDLLDWTKRAVESIRSFHDWDLFVVDNESTDGTQEWLREQGIEFVSKRCGVAAAQNIGFKKFLEGDWEYVLLLNNDIACRYDTIDSLVDMMEANPALAGLTATEELKEAPWMIDSVQPPGKGWSEIVDIPTSAYSCTMFTRAIAEKIGLFDDWFTPRYIEDNDYTLRLRIAGGKFAKSKEALFYHAVGAVLGAKEDERKARDHHWKKNIEYYVEKWGFAPHEPQVLTKVGPEHFPGDLCNKLREHVADEHRDPPRVRIKCYWAGLGDAIFRSILARELKRQIHPDMKVYYTVAFDPKKLQAPESLIRRAIYETYPYIDAVEALEPSTVDYILDITETEFRQEWLECAEFGRIVSARTEIYLRIAGLAIDRLKPDYFVKPEERAAATKFWAKHQGRARIVMAKTGSNKLKCWYGMDELERRLKADGHIVVHPTKEEMGFRELAAVIEQAHLVISPDSGPSNVAGALDVPAITLFSNRNGENFERMFPSMIAVQGECPYTDHNYCDYKMWCSKTEGPYRPKENGLGEPDCFRALDVLRVYNLANEVLK